MNARVETPERLAWGRKYNGVRDPRPRTRYHFRYRRSPEASEHLHRTYLHRDDGPRIERKKRKRKRERDGNVGLK